MGAGQNVAVLADDHAASSAAYNLRAEPELPHFHLLCRNGYHRRADLCRNLGSGKSAVCLRGVLRFCRGITGITGSFRFRRRRALDHDFSGFLIRQVRPAVTAAQRDHRRGRQRSHAPKHRMMLLRPLRLSRRLLRAGRCSIIRTAVRSVILAAVLIIVSAIILSVIGTIVLIVVLAVILAAVRIIILIILHDRFPSFF